MYILLASTHNGKKTLILVFVFQSKDSMTVGEKVNVGVMFKNSLNKTLTGCHFIFESAGNLKPTTIEIRYLLQRLQVITMFYMDLSFFLQVIVLLFFTYAVHSLPIQRTLLA